MRHNAVKTCVSPNCCHTSLFYHVLLFVKLNKFQKNKIIFKYRNGVTGKTGKFILFLKTNEK